MPNGSEARAFHENWGYLSEKPPKKRDSPEFTKTGMDNMVRSLRETFAQRLGLSEISDSLGLRSAFDELMTRVTFQKVEVFERMTDMQPRSVSLK